jgi:hypothetical protein
MAFHAARRPLIALALLAGVVGAGAPARAEEGGVFDFALGMFGLGGEDKPEITYRERAPLVVPPKIQELPPPQQSASAANPAWPQDPDVLRRKQKEEERRRPRMSSVEAEHASNRPITREERNAGYRPGATLDNSRGNDGRDWRLNADHYWNDPAMITELQKQNADSNLGETKLVAGQEPERRYLTDPPSGYRAPSAKAPVDLPPEPVKRKSKFNGEPITDIQ